MATDQTSPDSPSSDEHTSSSADGTATPGIGSGSRAASDSIPSAGSEAYTPSAATGNGLASPGTPEPAAPSGSRAADPTGELNAAPSPFAGDSSVSRTGTMIALGLSIVLVVGVLFAVRTLYYRATHQPVQVSSVAAPGAGSTECSQTIAALPTSIGKFDQVSLADPAPEATAVWAHASDRIVLRCGITAPSNYTTLSPTEVHNSVNWMPIADSYGTGTVTWYSLGRTQQIAVTGPASIADDLDALSSALANNPVSDSSATATPSPAPLSTVAMAPDPQQATCQQFIDSLPETFGDLRKSTTDSEGVALAEGSVAWMGSRTEPIVLRCGVAMPSDYRAGLTAQQINKVTWFNSSADSAASTTATAGSDGSAEQDSATTERDSSTWYTLNYSPMVAVHLPAGATNEAITAISEAVEASFTQTSE